MSSLPTQSECGTCSHAVIPSLGARARRGGGQAPAFRVARCRTRSGVRLDGLGWFLLGPVRVRWGPVWSRIGARFMYGPPGPATASPRALWGLVGTQRTPGGTVGPRLIGASPVWAARSSYWRQPVLLYQARAACGLVRVLRFEGQHAQAETGTLSQLGLRSKAVRESDLIRRNAPRNPPRTLCNC